jgi:hypothetical protein
MADDDTIKNCVTESCCGNDQPKQERALVKWLQKRVPKLSKDQAEDVAHALASEYDFADKGTLYAFKQSIIAYATGTAYTE